VLSDLVLGQVSVNGWLGSIVVYQAAGLHAILHLGRCLAFVEPRLVKRPVVFICLYAVRTASVAHGAVQVIILCVSTIPVRLVDKVLRGPCCHVTRNGPTSPSYEVRCVDQ